MFVILVLGIVAVLFFLSSNGQKRESFVVKAEILPLANTQKMNGLSRASLVAFSSTLLTDVNQLSITTTVSNTGDIDYTNIRVTSSSPSVLTSACSDVSIASLPAHTTNTLVCHLTQAQLAELASLGQQQWWLTITGFNTYKGIDDTPKQTAPISVTVNANCVVKFRTDAVPMGSLQYQPNTHILLDTNNDGALECYAYNNYFATWYCDNGNYYCGPQLGTTPDGSTIFTYNNPVGSFIIRRSNDKNPIYVPASDCNLPTLTAPIAQYYFNSQEVCQ